MGGFGDECCWMGWFWVLLVFFVWIVVRELLWFLLMLINGWFLLLLLLCLVFECFGFVYFGGGGWLGLWILRFVFCVFFLLCVLVVVVLLGFLVFFVGIKWEREILVGLCWGFGLVGGRILKLLDFVWVWLGFKLGLFCLG